MPAGQTAVISKPLELCSSSAVQVEEEEEIIGSSRQHCFGSELEISSSEGDGEMSDDEETSLDDKEVGENSSCSSSGSSGRRRRKRQKDSCEEQPKRVKAMVSHNENERKRRKDLKTSVHSLRDILVHKPRKPSTISVLKAAQLEIQALQEKEKHEEKTLDELHKRNDVLAYLLQKQIEKIKRNSLLQTSTQIPAVEESDKDEDRLQSSSQEHSPIHKESPPALQHNPVVSPVKSLWMPTPTLPPAPALPMLPLLNTACSSGLLRGTYPAYPYMYYPTASLSFNQLQPPVLFPTTPPPPPLLFSPSPSVVPPPLIFHGQHNWLTSAANAQQCIRAADVDTRGQSSDHQLPNNDSPSPSPTQTQQDQQNYSEPQLVTLQQKHTSHSSGHQDGNQCWSAADRPVPQTLKLLSPHFSSSTDHTLLRINEVASPRKTAATTSTPIGHRPTLSYYNPLPHQVMWLCHRETTKA